MFTGIIEQVGIIRSLGPNGLWLDVSFAQELRLGQSVACDGVCLTVVEVDDQGFRVDLLEETKRLTHFQGLEKGSLVNLERAMKADARFDGHIVQAHSEGVGVLENVEQEEREGDFSVSAELPTWLMTFSVPKHLIKYMILKGIIILNGIALTITHLDEEKVEIQVAITPFTWENTNLHALKPGDQVNVETDVLAKYVEKMVIG